MTDNDKPESAGTQEASPAENKTPVKGAEEVGSKAVEKPASETEKEWKELSGRTQERITRLIREKKALEAKVASQRSQPKPAQAPSSRELEDAVKKLKEHGVVTVEDLQRVEDRNFLRSEHVRLATKYSGKDGSPKYVSEEVEEYARSHYFGGNLEAAYKDMYEDERIDVAIKKRGLSKKTTYTEKPIASVKVGEKPLTVATLRERLKQPDGADWWLQNRDKIEPLMKKLSTT